MCSTSPVRGRPWAPLLTCRRSKCEPGNWTLAPTCSPSAWCSMRWRRDTAVPRRKFRGCLQSHSRRVANICGEIESRCACQAGRDHQQGSGERLQFALPACSRHADGLAAAEARFGRRPFFCCNLGAWACGTGSWASGREAMEDWGSCRCARPDSCGKPLLPLAAKQSPDRQGQYCSG